MVDKRLLALLVCPLCKGELEYHPQEPALICRFDRRAFPIRKNIPVLLEEEARVLREEERFR